MTKLFTILGAWFSKFPEYMDNEDPRFFAHLVATIFLGIILLILIILAFKWIPYFGLIVFLGFVALLIKYIYKTFKGIINAN